MNKVITAIGLILVLSLSIIPASSALTASTKECVELTLGKQRLKKVIRGSALTGSEKKQVNKCETRAKKFSKSSYTSFSEEYGLDKSLLVNLRTNFLAGEYGGKPINQILSAESISAYPGLTGHVKNSVTPKDFIQYYSEAIIYGLELMPSGEVLWDDPLLKDWLASGFPANKQSLARSLRDDSRYGYTYRANLEAVALAYGFGCGFGNQTACNALPAAEANVNALGPIVR